MICSRLLAVSCLVLSSVACSENADAPDDLEQSTEDLRRRPRRHGLADAAPIATNDAGTLIDASAADSPASPLTDAGTAPPPPTGPATAGPDIPANVVALSTFGGVPGASAATIRSAFTQAFARLKSLGGGTLAVGPGVYDLGEYASGVVALPVSDLRDVFISAYGAKLTMRTTAQTMPVFLGFQNPENVTVAGMSFYDFGTNLAVNWQGAICLEVGANTAHSRFRTVDVVAENVVTFLRSYSDYSFTGFDLHGTVKNSYYGVNPNYSGRFSKMNIRTENVRRGFIGYGAQNWSITIDALAGGVGSNGFISLIPTDSVPVHDIDVNVTMTGNGNVYGGVVHFYHQGPAGAPQYMRDIGAHVAFSNVAGQSAMFVFDHETSGGVIASTVRTWERIALTGSVSGSYAGSIVRNPSVSTGTTNSITVAPSLAAFQDIAALPDYFSVK